MGEAIDLPRGLSCTDALPAKSDKSSGLVIVHFNRLRPGCCMADSALHSVVGRQIKSWTSAEEIW